MAWGRVFTPAHAHLWTEFTGSRDLPDRVRSLYERTPRVLAAVDNLHLLNAWDETGNLAACLLLDSAPARFVSYIIGAHSRMHYTPYATDLLFREMIFSARKQGKKEIHLGLKVNEGIRRFKVKWGGLPEMDYQLAAWKERRFFQSCDQWPRMMKANERGYITGNLRKMFGTSTEFPSRTEQVIEKRDKRFLKRMLPFMEEGGCAVFVGTAHMLKLPGLLREAGFTVRGPGT